MKKHTYIDPYEGAQAFAAIDDDDTEGFERVVAWNEENRKEIQNTKIWHSYCALLTDSFPATAKAMTEDFRSFRKKQKSSNLSTRSSWTERPRTSSQRASLAKAYPRRAIKRSGTLRSNTTVRYGGATESTTR